MKIHIAYNKIDGEVRLVPTHRLPKLKKITPAGLPVESKRVAVVDSSIRDTDLLAMPNLAHELQTSDPDIDIEFAGKFINSTSRIVVDKTLKPVYNYAAIDVLTKPNGERMERPHMEYTGNSAGAIPVVAIVDADKLVDPRDATKQMIFSRSYYLAHEDGVSYKFLYDLAKLLADTGKWARLVAYDQDTKKPAPLVLEDGGKPYTRAFLEGRIDGTRYSLIMHLSDTELKAPPPAPAPAPTPVVAAPESPAEPAKKVTAKRPKKTTKKVDE